MANIMFGRSDLFGTRIFAGPGHRNSRDVIWPQIDGHFAIEFYDKRGVRTDIITSDMKDCPLIECEFSLDVNGCAGFTMLLAKEHTITIDYNQRVDIRLFGEQRPRYSGYITVKPIAGSTAPTAEYEGYGFFARLDGIIVNERYQDMDIAQIAADVIRRYIDTSSGAFYNGSKIYLVRYNATDVAFEYATAKDVLKQLAEFAINFQYGVDENREVFFRPINRAINENVRWWVGYHFNEFEPEEDIETVVNHIYVEGGKLSDSGTNIMYECSDDESINNYGLRAAVLKIPSAIAETDAKRWGDNELLQRKDPARTADIKNIHPDIVKRNIKADGMALVTSHDGTAANEYPIKEVIYNISSAGIRMDIKLGEYEKDISQDILNLNRDAANAQLLSRSNNKQLRSG